MCQTGPRLDGHPSSGTPWPHRHWWGWCSPGPSAAPTGAAAAPRPRRAGPGPRPSWPRSRWGCGAGRRTCGPCPAEGRRPWHGHPLERASGPDSWPTAQRTTGCSRHQDRSCRSSTALVPCSAMPGRARWPAHIAVIGPGPPYFACPALAARRSETRPPVDGKPTTPASGNKDCMQSQCYEQQGQESMPCPNASRLVRCATQFR